MIKNGGFYKPITKDIEEGLRLLTKEELEEQKRLESYLTKKQIEKLDKEFKEKNFKITNNDLTYDSKSLFYEL